MMQLVMLRPRKEISVFTVTLLNGSNTPYSNFFYMVATGQGKVREQLFFSRSGKSQGILILVRENGNFEKSQGKVTIVREN